MCLRSRVVLDPSASQSILSNEQVRMWAGEGSTWSMRVTLHRSLALTLNLAWTRSQPRTRTLALILGAKPTNLVLSCSMPWTSSGVSPPPMARTVPRNDSKAAIEGWKGSFWIRLGPSQ